MRNSKGQFMKGNFLGLKRPDMVGDKNPAKRPDVREKLSKVMKGNKNGLNHIVSENVKDRLRKMFKGKKLSQEHIKKLSLAKIGKYIGEKSWNWKGGITPIHNKIRSSIEYRLWQNSVFARDGYTCQKYGIKGGKLVAHHIQNFSKYPELRFAIDNGITLSKKAHKDFHKIYGVRNNTREQLDEFLKT